MTVMVDESLSIITLPLQQMLQSSPVFSPHEGTFIFTFLTRYSLGPSNTRHTCSVVPRPGCPLVLLYRTQII